MKITHGLLDHCVLQRNDKDQCDVIVKGYKCDDKPIELRATNTTQIPVLGNQDIKKAVSLDSTHSDAYAFSFNLTGLPTGGPYDLTLVTETESLLISDVLVGDLYLLEGQSNMQGIGLLEDRHEPHPMVRGFYMDDHWDVAEDPLHVLLDAIDPVHREIAGGILAPESPTVGTGPGVAIANYLYRETGVPQGLIACAHGGTSMDQWSPDHKELDGTTLYSAMLRRLNKNGNKAKGLFWYQGCNDTDNQSAPAYKEKMVHWVENLRQDLKKPDFPIVIAQLSRVCYPDHQTPGWDLVQHDQYLLGQEIPHLHTVPTIDLEMDDFIHISGAAHRTLGIRMGQAMLNLIDQESDYMPPISVRSIEMIEEENNWNTKVIITYDNVMGSLVSQGLPSGFSISVNPHKKDVNSIYKITLKENQVILSTVDVALDTGSRYLHYGFGPMPYCNIKDEANRSLPVIHALQIGSIRHLSDPCSKAWISNVTYGNDINELIENTSLSYNVRHQTKPSILSTLNENYTYTDFYYFFMNVFSKFLFANNEAYGHIHYLVPFELKGKMEGYLLTGCDAYMSLYLDGELLLKKDYQDIKTTPENDRLQVKLDEGFHMIEVDYIRPSHKGSGIFLRFECNDDNEISSIPNWLFNE